MNYSDTRFTLDVQLHQAQVSVSATLNDTARRLCVGFTDGRKPYVIAEGCTATFAAKKPDGLALFNACTVENNTIIYEFTPQTTNVIGTYECEIRLYDEDGKQLTSPRFLLVVDEQAINDDDVIDSFTEVTMLNQIIANESERIVKEDERIANEDTRNANEDERIANENNRIENESMRKSAEQSRADAEVARVLAEENRVSKDQLRDSWEYLRQDSESVRDSAESQRIAAENEREQEEIVRANEEASRDQAEGQRVTNENTRRSNENTRISNEYQRIANESAREARIMSLENRVGNVESFAQFNSSDIDKLEDFLEYTHPETDDNIFLRCYPRGSIYMSVNPTDPASLFGGSWVALTNRFLVGAGGAYGVKAEGGATSHKHGSGTLGATVTMSNSSILISSIQQKDGINHKPTAKINASTRETYTGETDYIVPVIGSTGDANYLPPYYAVYMWRREA